MHKRKKRSFFTDDLTPLSGETIIFKDYRLPVSHVFNIRHPENAVILSEQFTVFRRETMRQCLATLQQSKGEGASISAKPGCREEGFLGPAPAACISI